MIKTVGIPIYGEKSANINVAYIDYVAEAGYVPVLINEHCVTHEPLMDMCDALLLPGGIDIDPLYYYEDNISSINVNPDKDAFERMLLDFFIGAEKKVFGICRGFQLIVREFLLHDATLVTKLHYYQHIGGHSQKDNGTERKNFSHTVRIAENDLYGSGDNVSTSRVNSMHHQALVLPMRKDTRNIETGSVIKGKNIDVAITAVSYKNIPSKSKFIVEGIKIESLGISAVQWHPEELRDIELLTHALEE